MGPRIGNTTAGLITVLVCYSSVAHLLIYRSTPSIHAGITACEYFCSKAVGLGLAESTGGVVQTQQTQSQLTERSDLWADTEGPGAESWTFISDMQTAWNGRVRGQMRVDCGLYGPQE